MAGFLGLGEQLGSCESNDQSNNVDDSDELLSIILSMPSQAMHSVHFHAELLPLAVISRQGCCIPDPGIHSAEGANPCSLDMQRYFTIESFWHFWASPPSAPSMKDQFPMHAKFVSPAGELSRDHIAMLLKP